MTYPSLTAASGATGIPVAVLKQLKRAGAAGFETSNRVDLLKLLLWLAAGRGKGWKPGPTLDEARATLAAAKAEQIQREAEIAGGASAPIGWFLACVNEAFEEAGARDWLMPRIGQLAWLMAHAAYGHGKAGLPEEEAVAEAERLLRGEAAAIQGLSLHAKGILLQKLRKGPPGGPPVNLLVAAEKRLTELSKKLSPAARAEVRRAITRGARKGKVKR